MCKTGTEKQACPLCVCEKYEELENLIHFNLKKDLFMFHYILTPTGMLRMDVKIFLQSRV